MSFDPSQGFDVASVPDPTPELLDQQVHRVAAKYALDPPLVRAVMHQESGGNPYAVSDQGAAGLMQLEPETAAGLGVRHIFNWVENLDGGAKYLREGLDKYGGRPDLALAYYHGGPNEDQWGPRTANYVNSVMDAYHAGRERAMQPSAPPGGFDPSKPFQVAPAPSGFDPSRPFELVPQLDQPGTPTPSKEAVKTLPMAQADQPGWRNAAQPAPDLPAWAGGAPAQAPPPAAQPEQPGVLGRIWNAAKQGWETAAPAVTPEIQQRLNTSPLVMNRFVYGPLAEAATGVLGVGSALMGAQTQALDEAGRAVGIPDLPADIMALPGIAGEPMTGFGAAKSIAQAGREARAAASTAATTVPTAEAALSDIATAKPTPEAAAAVPTLQAMAEKERPASPTSPVPPMPQQTALGELEKAAGQAELPTVMVRPQPAPAPEVTTPPLEVTLPEPAAQIPENPPLLSEPAKPTPAAPEVTLPPPEVTTPVQENIPAKSARAAATPFVSIPPEPERLSSFLRRLGGVQDVGGDIRSSLGGAKYRPGLINNRNGLPLDEAALRAWENGYFPELGDSRPDINQLRDALDDDLKGRPRYSHLDDVAVSTYQRALEHNQEIDRLATQHNIDTTGKTPAQFFDELADHLSTEDAAREAESLAAGHEADYAEAEKQAKASLSVNVPKEPWTAAEFYGQSQARSLGDLEREYQQEEAAIAAQQRLESIAEPGPAAGNEGAVSPVSPPGAGGAGAAGRAATEGAGPATDLLGRPLAEPRARVGPEPTIRTDERQIAIPGTEASAVQAQAARDAQGRGALQTEVPQKPPDEGLFAEDTSGQNEMRLYSFPGNIFDADLWGRIFKSRDPRQLRQQLGLGLSARDEMGVAAKMADEVKTMFAPTARGPAAKEMEHIIRRRTSMLARSSNQSAYALDQFAKAMDRLPVEEQVAITDLAERGEKQATPALQTAMDALRQQQDLWKKRIQGLGRGYLEQARENYMGHIWANYREWRAGLEAEPPTEAERIAMAQGISKRPIRGSGAFLKQRTFDTQREGINAGLIPVTTNPIRLQLLKLREMQKFYHGTKMADEIKASGLARWVPAGQEYDAMANGMAKLDDSVFKPKVRQGETGPLFEPGAWFAPEPAARIFNNYVSQGIAGHSVIYDAIRRSGNALNSAQLGLSGFHATFVTLDSMMSRFALGLQQLSRGDVGRGLGSLAATPIAPVQTMLRGSALRRAWLNPENATPAMRELANALNVGGGRINMDQFYRANASGSFFKNLHDLKNPGGAWRDVWQTVHGTPLTAPFKLVGRLVDTINEPLMGQMVPRMKLGVFSDMAQDWLRRNPDATPEEYSAAMTKAWDSVENRMGQMTYDNVFWNKTGKDIAFITTRSVGWNLGTLREIGGGAVDLADQVRKMAQGKAPELTNRMAYTIAMPIVTATIGAMLTYLATGHGPQQMLDYFYPPSGTTTNGQTDRVSIPGYIKDVVAFSKDPVQTVLNKLQPLAETSKEIAMNRDYYGGIIYMPGQDNGLAAYGEYLLNQSLPFSTRAMLKENRSGASMGAQALAFWGIQPAPQSVVNPERGAAFKQREDIKAFKKRMREPGRMSLSP